MAWFKKKPDLISNRSRELGREIAELEARIQQLDTQLEHNHPPRLRSTAVPHGTTVTHSSPTPAAPAAPVVHEPIFEQVDQDRLQAPAESAESPDRFNELGMRKYDLPALLQRIRNHLRGPSTSNPKLVSYLAAGGIQGLRPLRIKKRVRRNQIMTLFGLIFFVLLGILAVYCYRGR